jgi:hypothetical protein
MRPVQIKPSKNPKTLRKLRQRLTALVGCALTDRYLCVIPVGQFNSVSAAAFPEFENMNLWDKNDG